MYKHILLPTDGSKLADKAVKQGIALAKSLGARVTVVNVTPEFRMVMDEGFVLPNSALLKKRFDDETSRRSKAVLEAHKATAVSSTVACETVMVTSGRPYDAIIKQAKKGKCDLIMMASHGRSGLSSILLGSETAKVLTHSTIPVLVVR
jgi:nucleotide-binding universal stress UspA family protein